MTFTIQGFDSSYKVPKFAAALLFGAGIISGASAPLACLLVGMKTSAGSMTPDLDVLQISGTDDAEAYAGPGSQLASMAYVAFQGNPNITCYIAACADPAGTASTTTLLIAGTATSAGTFTMRIAGINVSGPILNGDIPATLGPVIAAAINKNTRLPFTAAFSTATVTLTAKNTGLSGNSWVINWDPTQVGTGLTFTLTGSAAINSNANRVFSGATLGAGTESQTTILTKLTGRRFARVAVAAFDSTSAIAWLTQTNTKAGSTTLLLDQVCFGHNGTYANAQTLAQTNLNGVRVQVLWGKNAENHPCQLAASNAATRSAVENDTPIFDFDGYALPGLIPLQSDADVPTDAAQNTALQNGVTPLTNGNGGLAIVRAITTHCLTGTTADYRTIDIGDVAVPDRFTIECQINWSTNFRQQNPIVGDDPPSDGPFPLAGVAYPKLWTAEVNKTLGAYFLAGWIQDPSLNPPSGYFDAATDRIMESVVLLGRRLQHQIGQRVMQTRNA